MGFWPFGGSSESKPAPEKQAEPAAAPKKKICCACPDTKKLRDDCIPRHGEDHPYCAALIEAHKACLRLEGFNV